MADFNTVRLPELEYGLPLATSLAPEDRILLWLSALDKTVYVELKDISAAIGGGGGTPTPTPAPSTGGKRIIFVIPADLAGDDVIPIPSLAGKDFELSLEGRPLIKRDPNDPKAEDEYEVLSTGGFRLIGNTVGEGQRFSLDLYTLVQQNDNTTSSPLFSGVLPMAANRSLTVDDLGFLYQLRGGNNSITITLPSLTVVPDNQPLIFETAISNTKPHRLQTTAGQMIYVNRQGLTALYMHPGETLWLIKGDDGFYCISDYGKYYSLIGKPVASYSVEADEVLLNGQELSRALYPRLWEKAQTFSASFVDEATWQIASVSYGGETVLRPYRGCWSNGNGSTTFRVPDLMNAFLRGVKNIGGSDAERYQNIPGVWQNDKVGQVTVSGTVPARASGTGGGGSIADGNNDGQGTNVSVTFTGGGTETRPGNIGVLWVTKF